MKTRNLTFMGESGVHKGIHSFSWIKTYSVGTHRFNTYAIGEVIEVSPIS